jgi:hypothetical protein
MGVPKNQKYNQAPRNIYIYNGRETPHLPQREIFSLWPLWKASFLRQSRA